MKTFQTKEKPKLIEQMRNAMRVRHYAYSTEKSYLRWIIKFIKHHNLKHPSEMGEREVSDFLSSLVSQYNVTANTQNQALSAIIFLYKHVLNQELKNLEFGFANKPSRIPEVFNEEEVEKEVKKYNSWMKINELGFLDRGEVADVLGMSKAGIVTFHALPNHIDAQPNKMFEYMSAGLPLITSNFPFWREIVEKNNCGICVDPMNP